MASSGMKKMFIFSSDLRKPCLIAGKSLSLYTKFYSVHEKYLIRCYLTEWEACTYIWEENMVKKMSKYFADGRLENKMADFSNHRRLSLRYLSQDLIPVSIRLRSTIKTPKGYHIIRKAERALLNERIHSINNTLNMLEIQRDTCKNQLEETLDRENMEECEKFIMTKREAKHLKTLNQQRNKIWEIVPQK